MGAVGITPQSGTRPGNGVTRSTLPSRQHSRSATALTWRVHLPLVYPASYRAEGTFALGSETDHICPDNGPTRCIGGKLLLVGEEDEVKLVGLPIH